MNGKCQEMMLCRNVCWQTSPDGPSHPAQEPTDENDYHQLLQEALQEKDSEIEVLQKRVKELEEEKARTSHVLNKALLREQQAAILSGTTR